MSYDPHSPDSMFSRIMEKLEHQDRVLEKVDKQTERIDGRVASLEHDRWYQRGIIAAISVGFSALYSHFFKS